MDDPQSPRPRSCPSPMMARSTSGPMAPDLNLRISSLSAIGCQQCRRAVVGQALRNPSVPASSSRSQCRVSCASPYHLPTCGESSVGVRPCRWSILVLVTRFVTHLAASDSLFVSTAEASGLAGNPGSARRTRSPMAWLPGCPATEARCSWATRAGNNRVRLGRILRQGATNWCQVACRAAVAAAGLQASSRPGRAASVL